MAYAWGNACSCRKALVGADTSRNDVSSRSGGAICPQKAGSMCGNATVALKRKKPPSSQVRRSRRPANRSRPALAPWPARSRVMYTARSPCAR